MRAVVLLLGGPGGGDGMAQREGGGGSVPSRFRSVWGTWNPVDGIPEEEREMG